MRTQILLARKHDEKTFALLCGPEVPILEQENIFREYRMAGNAHDEIAEIQRWEPDQGSLMSQKFQKPSDLAKNAAKVKADYAAHQEAMANPAKAAKAAKAAAEKAAKEQAEKNKKAHDEVTAKAAAEKKAQDEQAAKNIAEHKKNTLMMAERRAAADKAAAEKATAPVIPADPVKTEAPKTEAPKTEPEGEKKKVEPPTEITQPPAQDL